MEHQNIEATDQEVSPDVEPSPSINDVLDEMRDRARASCETITSPRHRSLVGEVVEAPSQRSEGRALIAWAEDEGLHFERWLSVVRGLALRAGDRVLLNNPDNWPELIVTNAIASSTEPAERFEVSVDGQRVEVEGKDEVVLRCGEASITLRRNGRLVIRGTYVETRSKGTNRIRGGSVQIN